MTESVIVEGQIPDLLAEVNRLRAANTRLVETCNALLKAFWYDNDTDVLEQSEVVLQARRALAESEADNG